MNGQWIGTFKGTNNGNANLNIDLVNNQYEGQVVLADYNEQIPSSTARVKLIKTENNTFKGYLSKFQPINKITLLPDLWDNIKNQFDANTRVPNSGELTANNSL